ncbi:MAG TPA: shikimate kinase [Candidatus Faecivivens stercorigallinarum]|nr:shikimate kinase [Candidatus Faecivivens stercorigallinarum]
MKLTKNIVLIGLSGSGKTAFSKRLAARYGLPLVDMDSEIVKKAGKSINEIFAEQGEEAFRQMETECARTCGKLTGTIISTGGGVILREENMQALKQNGLVIFMDRLPEDILGEDLSDRPLVADDQRKIYRQREQRYPLYVRYADAIVRNCKAKEDTEAALVDALEKLLAKQSSD